MLRIYQFAGASQGYIEQVGGLLDTVGLGLSLWQGEYEGTKTWWLRWTDREGRLIPTGAELAQREQQRATEAEQRAEASARRAEQERQRAERLAARLRELGAEAVGSTREQLAEAIRSQDAMWGPVARAAGVTAE